MSKTNPSTVLVVLDCGAREADVLRTLPSLADASAPEVLGLFIEDEDLLGAARLPGTVEISVTDLRTAQLDPERIERDLATQAASAQRIFETTARRCKLRHSFRVSRGRTGEMLVKAAVETDTVIVCRPLRASGLRARRAAEFHALMGEHGRVLFVNEPWASGVSVVAVCADASDNSREALERASAMAGS